MKVTGKIKDITLDIESRHPIVMLEINEKQEMLCHADELMKAECLDVEMKKHRKKRSLSANAYAWAMMDQLAEALSIPKEKIYRDIIKNIGGNSTYVKVREDACEKLIEQWSKNGLGWCGEIIDTDEEYADIVLYYGSSTYDTKQMSRLIELVIQECEEQGISTETLERAAYWEGLLER